jgi:hypothetical protein
MHPPFGTPGFVLLGCWVVLAVLVARDPGWFFSTLSFGRVSLPVKLVSVFRVLGILNAIGSVYLIAHYAFSAA